MATYDFLVTGVDPEMTLEGQAQSDAEAWREAVLLASEIMRERPLLQSGAFRLRVRVTTPQGKNVCCVEACADAV